MAFLDFDATGVPPREEFEILPAGEYSAIITESQFKPTKNGTGQYLQLKLQIVTGKFKNRILFDRLNLVNGNEQAALIARQTLAEICAALGKNGCADSTELHDKPLNIRIAVKEASGNFKANNEVKGYKPYTDVTGFEVAGVPTPVAGVATSYAGGATIAPVGQAAGGSFDPSTVAPSVAAPPPWAQQPASA